MSETLYDKFKRFQQFTHSENPTPSAIPSKNSSKSLPDSLRNIPGIVPAKELIGKKQKLEEIKNEFLLHIGVEERITPEGKYGYRETIYPYSELNFSPQDISGNELALQSRDSRFAPIQAAQLLFIDTETTGLAGGAGTVPFLIGMGFFAFDGFHVVQFLMRDYDEEPAVLQAVEQRIASYSSLATYNGKSFDLPLLSTRYTLNRRKTRLDQLLHIDLIHPARRLWRDLAPDCSLSTLEEFIFGRTRPLDIPGEQIPYAYFDFLRDIRIQRMELILVHNAEDLVALAALTAKTCCMLRDPLRECRHAREIYSIARSLTAAGEYSQAQYYLEEILNREKLPIELRREFCQFLSLLYKRTSQIEKAAALWSAITEEMDDLFAVIELAKYYEHTEKQYVLALRCTETALQLVGQLPPAPKGRKRMPSSLQELHHRRKRLLSKIDREP